VARLWHTCLLGHALLVLVLIGMYVLIPAARMAFVREDGLIEQGTAVAYLLAGVYGIAAWLAARGNRPSALLLAVPALALLGFLDEVSYGQSFLRFSAPIIAKTELDSGHDLLQMATKNVNVVSLCLIVPAGAAAMWIVMRNARLQRFTRGVWQLPPGRFVVTAVALGVMAQIIDTAKIDYLRSVVAIEETLELLAATTMLSAAAAIGLSRQPGQAIVETSMDEAAPIRVVEPTAHRRAA
jgi:hypothetical protein